MYHNNPPTVPNADPDTHAGKPLRGLTKRWLPRGTTVGTAGAEPLPGVAPLVSRILCARGVADPETAARFCDPRLTHLHDPGLLPDIDRAAQRILNALQNNERVAVYGDYDVDGVTAAAILFHAFCAIEPGLDTNTETGNLRVYIPHRLEEGYGLNPDAVRELAAWGAKVIVSVDCGVTAIQEAELAKELGVDLIITDHHTPPASVDDLPDAYAVVHPGRPDSKSPFADLCGAAVAFKLAWRTATTAAASERVPARVRDVLMDCLALAGMGTVADVVPLVNENRPITKHGLARVRATSIDGLNALIRESKLEGENIDAEHVGFVIGPRLNACGRMGHAEEALELLTTASGQRAATIASDLTALNNKRRSVERTIFTKACQMAEEAGMVGDGARAIVLAHKDWHPGVVGIVCSRLVERYGRPAALLQHTTDGIRKGSCRSIDGFDIHHALAACSEHLRSFGGHQMAAGLSVQDDAWEHFVKAFTKHADNTLSPEDLAPAVKYDDDTDLRQLTTEAVRVLERLSPFGRGNPKPTLLARNLKVIRPGTPMGARGKHMQCTVQQHGTRLRIVAWGWGEKADFFREGRAIDAVIRPKINAWRGTESVEAELVDARDPHHDTPLPNAAATVRAPVYRR